MKGIHPIGVAERRSGLSAHVIRAWENRYNAVSPDRSEGNQRLYSEADIERLVMLAKAVKSGERIRRIAGLSMEDLEGVAESENTRSQSGEIKPLHDDTVDRFLVSALSRIATVDQTGLEETLSAWLFSRGIDPFIERLVPALMSRIGSMWGDGNLSIYQEHMASESVRSFLGEVFKKIRTTGEGPVVVTATPPREMHDIGALLCAMATALEGFEVIHLGPDVPLIEVVHLAKKREAAAVLLSIVLEGCETRLVEELQTFGERIGIGTRIFLGGRGAEWYAAQIHAPRVEYVATLAALRTTLRNL